MHKCESTGCAEYRALSRRQFMARTGGAAAAVAAPAWLPRVVMAQDYCSNRDIVVSIFLRGAADGLTLCVPHFEDAYYSNRPTISVPRPDDPNTGTRCIDLDGSFGFPQPMGSLTTAFGAGRLLIVHACGSTDPSRSHFEAQRFWEVGKPNDLAVNTGWLGRHLVSAPPMLPNSILRAVGIGYGLQATLTSSPQSLPIPDLDAFGLTGNAGTLAARRTALEDMYEPVADPLRAAAQTTMDTIDLLNTINFAGYAPENSAIYPSGSFGYAMKTTAALIKADVGVEAIAIDVNGWDTHNNQGSTAGTMATLMTTLANTLSAFHLDMFGGSTIARNVTVIVQSEFGRQLHENGSFGSDHGHGNVMMLLGNNIAGGRVLRNWPGLQPQNLFEGRDLQVTIDFRDILAEVVSQRLGNTNLGYVFPGYVPTFRGVTTNCNRGDMNCDGLVNAADAPAFAQAMVDPEGYQAAHPNCNMTNADFNNDGRADSDDLQGFANAVAQP